MTGTRRTVDLLRQAADHIADSARSLKQSSTVGMVWKIHDQSDMDAMASYAQEIRLARNLRAEAHRIEEELTC